MSDIVSYFADQTCAVCMESIRLDDACMLRECLHPFCYSCALSWFRVGGVVCPLCKGKAISVLHDFQSSSRFIETLAHRLPLGSDAVGQVPVRAPISLPAIQPAALPDPQLPRPAHRSAASDWSSRVDLYATRTYVAAPRGHCMHIATESPASDVPVLANAPSREMRSAAYYASARGSVELRAMRPFVCRELRALLGASMRDAAASVDIDFWVELVLTSLTRIDTSSPAFLVEMNDILGLHRRQFVHMLDVFRLFPSPLSLERFDRMTARPLNQPSVQPEQLQSQIQPQIVVIDAEQSSTSTARSARSVVLLDDDSESFEMYSHVPLPDTIDLCSTLNQHESSTSSAAVAPPRSNPSSIVEMTSEAISIDCDSNTQRIRSSSIDVDDDEVARPSKIARITVCIDE